MLLAPLATTQSTATGEGRGPVGVVPVVNVVVGLFVGRLVQVIGTSEPTG
jgi:hypothetical protein